MSTSIPESHEELLERTGFAHLASIGADGEPQSHPVWYEWSNDHLKISTTSDRQKLANVRREPRVAATIQDPDNPYRYIEVRGEVESIRDDEDRAFIDSLAQRYLGEETYPWHQPDDERVIIEIAPIKTNTMGE